MNNILMYCHNGSKNHGCEAIIRSTVGILNKVGTMQYYQISRNMSEDKEYGVDRLVQLLPEFSEVPHSGWPFLGAYLTQKFLNNPEPMNMLSCKIAFAQPQGPTVSLSIGGDNYCYKGYKTYCRYHQISREMGHKTVLWGCSVEPSFLEFEDLLADLKTFDKILVRESISYQAMKDKGLDNVYLYPDPAFTLQPDPMATVLPPDNTVGINISPLALDYGSENSKIMDNYVELIRYILKNTNMNVALVPHVIWDGNDDRVVLRRLKEQFFIESRVFLVDDMDAVKLKAYISRLRFLVAARTHATIAAYSTGVPTLVAGYSVKSRGIARDIFGTEENYVVPVKEMTDIHELTQAFCWIMEHEKEIHTHLHNFMPEYIARSYAAGKEIANFFSDDLLKAGIAKERCMGCSACVNACPTNSLRMTADQEGFLYPELNQQSCVDCGRCAKVCPMNREIPALIPVTCQAAKNRNDEIRMNSSSGGVFSILAEHILQEQGVVYGAALDHDYVVHHVEIQTVEQLSVLRGAKYSQSIIGDTYQQAKKHLDQGREVLFSGTPCQIAGLYAYLGHSYENLVCVDMICHGVPSPRIWKEYLKEISPNGLPRALTFRSKDTGWSRYQYAMKAEYDDGSVFCEKNADDIYLQGMVQDLYLRPSCTSCQFKGFEHPGDLTLGDFWGIWNEMPDFDDNRGVSAVIINTESGRRLFNACIDQLESRLVSLEQVVAENPSWQRSAAFPRERSIFFETFRRSSRVDHAVRAAQASRIPPRSMIDTLSTLKHKLLHH